MESIEKHSLYRHFDKNDHLLYVGISVDPLNRLKDHRQQAVWFEQISRVDVEKFDSREYAANAEIEAIKSENPIYNIAHKKPINHKAKKWAREYNYCEKCGTDESKHSGHGICVACYLKGKKAINQKQQIMSYCFQKYLEDEDIIFCKKWDPWVFNKRNNVRLNMGVVQDKYRFRGYNKRMFRRLICNFDKEIA